MQWARDAMLPGTARSATAAAAAAALALASAVALAVVAVAAAAMVTEMATDATAQDAAGLVGAGARRLPYCIVAMMSFPDCDEGAPCGPVSSCVDVT